MRRIKSSGLRSFVAVISVIVLCSSCGTPGKTLSSSLPITVGFCPSGMSESTQGYYKKCLADAYAGSQCLFFKEYVANDSIAAAYIDLVDALISPGSTKRDSSVRGRSENLLIAEALRQGKPVLGICYGHQYLNKVLGGNHTSVRKLSPESDIDHMLVDSTGFNVSLNSEHHNINIVNGSRLSHVLGDVDSVMVNSSHKYSLSRIGDGATVVATADDGIVESIEGKGYMGVQFHPEYLYGKLGIERFRGIFKALCDDAVKHKFH